MKRFSWSLIGLLFIAGLSAQSGLEQLSGLQVDGSGRVFLGTVKTGVAIGKSGTPEFLRELIDNDALTLVAESSERDNLGLEHTKFRIEKEGVILANKRILAHFKNGLLSTVNGDLQLPEEFQGSFTISESQALAAALQKVGAVSYKWENPANDQLMRTLLNNPGFSYQPVGKKVYLEKGSKMLAAWKFTIYATEPLYRGHIYVDASSGSILEEENLLCSANVPGTAVTKYSGTQSITVDQNGGQYRFRQTASGQGVETYNLHNTTNYNTATDFTNTSSSWTTTGFDQGAADAHWGAERTHAYYLTQHSRNSLDNAGMKLISYVHYDNGFTNAFWDGSVMTYGDGSGNWGIFSSLDVCGHEITHGLTENTSNLVYSNESGALNESFSDMFGASIENYARPSNWNWKIGEDINVTGLRTMSNPNQFTDPDTYKGTYWYSGTGDNGGVHTNSGVPNFWYYLLVTGGAGTNDLSQTFSIQGLGFNTASKIAFRALTVYFTPTTDFAAARAACIQSAKDLFGDCSNELIQTANAWHAVGVGPKIVSGSVLPDFTSKVSSFCSVPAVVKFTNTTPYAQLYSWDFGDGGLSTAQNPAHTYTAGGTYSVKMKATGCNLTDSIQKQSYVVVDIPQPPAVVSATACYGNAATLYANANGFVQWYDVPTNTVSLHAGVMLGISSLTSNLNFYVNNTYTFGTLSGGITLPTGGGFSGNNANYLVFDVLQPGVLNSIVVSAQNAGARTFQMRSSSNAVLASKIVTLTAGSNTVQLDFALTPGNDFELGLSASSNAALYRSTSGANYPYNIGNYVTITGSSQGPGAYYFAYNWQVTRNSCVSSMSSLSASVVPLPTVNAGVSSEIVCEGDMVPVTVNPLGGLLTGQGAIGNSFQSATAGSFLVTYTYYDENQCSNTSSFVMHVQECTGVSETAGEGFRIYPNPARAFVKVSGIGEGFSVNLCDMSGRKLSAADPHAGEAAIDLSGYAAGLYLVTITSPQGQVVSSHRIVRE